MLHLQQCNKTNPVNVLSVFFSLVDLTLILLHVHHTYDIFYIHFMLLGYPGTVFSIFIAILHIHQYNVPKVNHY